MVEAVPIETNVSSSKERRKKPMPKPGKLWKYCLSAKQDEEKVLVPLTSVSVKSELRGPLATIEVELTYLNPLEDSPLECTYTFPLEKTSFLAKLEAKIDDRVIATQVKDK